MAKADRRILRKKSLSGLRTRGNKANYLRLASISHQGDYPVDIPCPGKPREDRDAFTIMTVTSIDVENNTIWLKS
jgi:hypothetical protein